MATEADKADYELQKLNRLLSDIVEQNKILTCVCYLLATENLHDIDAKTEEFRRIFDKARRFIHAGQQEELEKAWRS